MATRLGSGAMGQIETTLARCLSALAWDGLPGDVLTCTFGTPVEPQGCPA
jgi:hypothetical protein